MTNKKNFLRCWECKIKDKDCYCNLNNNKNLKEINKEIDKEIKS